MNIDNICKLLLKAISEAGFNESTLLNYRGVIRRSKAFCKGKGLFGIQHGCWTGLC